MSSFHYRISSWLTRLNSNHKFVLQFIFDGVLTSFCFCVSMLLRFDGIGFFYTPAFQKVIVVLIPCNLIALYLTGSHRELLRFYNLSSLKPLFLAIFASSTLLGIVAFFLQIGLPRSVPFIFLIVSVLMFSWTRFVLKSFLNFRNAEPFLPVAVLGVNESARQVFALLQSHERYKPACFIDPEDRNVGQRIGGLKVFKPSKALALLKDLKIGHLVVSHKDARAGKFKKFIKAANASNLAVHVTLDEQNTGGLTESNSALRQLKIEDLLGRDSVPSDITLLYPLIKDKGVLVTGGGGSIGSELCRQIFALGVKHLVILEQSEFALYSVEKALSAINGNDDYSNVFPILGSVTNENLVADLIKKYAISTIFHAAAYKHVPIIQENIIAGIQNNVFGTSAVLESAIKNRVKNFVLISTDKAVGPTTYMGASKALAELVCKKASKNHKSINIAIVRFGNVIGSSGSVIPLFQKQILDGGPLTLTHKQVTRYFMTIEEAAQLVIQAGAMSQGGEVYVLNMGQPVKISEVAEQMITLSGRKPTYDNKQHQETSEYIEIREIGLRSGEKLHEILHVDSEIEDTIHPRIMKVKQNNETRIDIEYLLEKLNLSCSCGDVDGVKRKLVDAFPDLDVPS